MSSSEPSDVIARRTLAPDPGLVKSLGTHHSLESAVADLVDNSLDAGATEVLIQLAVKGRAPTGLAIADNGKGMNDASIDEAMRIGRQREYGSHSHGYFGLGLKSASFSQADVLTAWSKQEGANFVGRRIRRADVLRDFSCEILGPGTAADASRRLLSAVSASQHGTIIWWSETRLPSGGAFVESGEWLDNAKTKLRMHLGIIYHRLLTDARLRIRIEVFDPRTNTSGPREVVAPIDPLGFKTSGVSGWPRVLATQDGSNIKLNCYIVPPRSSGPEFRLYGRDGSEFQGIFVYRADRLLQAGGWNNILSSTPSRALARVVIDDFDQLSEYVQMTPEKHGLMLSPQIAKEIGVAREADPEHGGLTFTDYIARAEEVLSQSRKRRRTRRPVAEPSRGFHERLRSTIKAEIPIRNSEEPVEIRWKPLADGKFFELDRELRTIFLNQLYRKMLTGGRTGLSDAPLIKALVFFLTEQHFTGQYWGSKDRDLIDMWDEVLGPAALLELDYRSRDERHE